jgi:hypothetical protein
VSDQTSTPSTPVALACDPGALDRATRTEHFTWIRDELPRLVMEVSELPDGIGLKFPAADLAAVATFVDRERRCCPFLRFDLALPPGEEILWLRITGPEGVKRFLHAVRYVFGALKSTIAVAMVVSKSCRAESPSSRRAAP